MQPLEVIFVKERKVSCNGGKSISSHPLVYLNMGQEDSVVCPYCSKYFTIKDAGKKPIKHFGRQDRPTNS